MADAGLFGGTFNPLHNGHLGIIKFVQQACGLEQIFLYPSATPPHKSNDNLAPARDRLEMVRQSIAGLDGFSASDMELRRRGPSFTIDTIEDFKAAFGPGINFHLLVGSDAFFDITTWKEKDRIFAAVPVIVMLRGAPPDPGAVASFIDEHISKGYTLRDDQRFVHRDLNPIRICRVPRIDISSTMIRDRVRLGKPITDLVPGPVEAIINAKDLYR